MKTLITAATALLIAGPAFSNGAYFSPEDYPKAWVLIDDQAKNGCWTNIGEVKSYAEDQMELAGFNVVAEMPMAEDDRYSMIAENGFQFKVTVDARRLNDGLCVGYIDTTFFAPLVNPNRRQYILWGEIGAGLNPWTVWSQKNFNNFALDFVKDSIPAWVEAAKLKSDEAGN